MRAISTVAVKPLCQRFYSIAIPATGVEGRLPLYDTNKHIKPNNINQAVTITDPFQIYQNYISLGILEKDELQLRVMKEFQKLYHRVIDYTPPEELSIKLSLLLREIEIKQSEINMRRRSKSPFKFLSQNPEKTKKSLVKFMTDEEELSNFASPQGLLVHGDVGSGKSLLMDIFASSLPHKSKMRWHFNNFILWVFNEMHNIQQHRSKIMDHTELKHTMENEFILYEIAQKMIAKNTILMLDEFVLPDIASANIIKILFTFYFKLGGVLIATSNKLPEELYSTQFHKLKFKSFVGILNSRCQTIDMKSTKDYRTYFASESNQEPYLVVRRDNEANQDQIWDHLIKTKALGIPEDSNLMDKSLKELGKPSEVRVYNRTTKIPLSFNDDTICYLDYGEICQGLTSSSDYITITSKYKTIILDNVPIMTTKMKNEARRFITLLDAVYESKCQFFMRSQVDIDYLFFPDALKTEDKEFQEYLKLHLKSEGNEDRLEVQDEEMFAKTSIAMSNPYRPNIVSYDSEKTEHYNEPSSTRTVPKSNYSNIKAFQGDDEKFAFKRAVSRIKEMVLSDNWRKQDRWISLHDEMRPWENVKDKSVSKVIPSTNFTSNDDKNMENLMKDNSMKDIIENLSVTLPKDYTQSKNIPFRLFNSKIAPIFDNLQNFWAMGSWTSSQGKRLKDRIGRSWIRSSIRDHK
ncbi:uncharacterized protein KGF55_002581 [Candida pseudojiufengensis]|uniref:uncharacterized protein n=1 Tax=Candida pseudojiufengensis TaxID=497109 RepID=UPI002225B092|nr:uncharacterized protein KGF55_002581 [Candida pseudojiufengensis]KAI5963701.1 hypothetical protein KGF55_002581 [Candida pseudojiufengensis]